MFQMPTSPTLNRVPEKAVRLILALAKLPRARQAMEAAGFDQAEIDEGWRLVRSLQDATSDRPTAELLSDARAKAAHRRLASEGMAFVRRVEATLQRRHPAMAETMAAAFEPGQQPVLAVDTLLQSLNALVLDARPESAAVLALLEDRKLGQAVRRELAELVDIAIGRDAAPVPADDGEARRSARLDNLVALYRWYQEWTTTARSVVPHRHDLIVMGLAKPRKAAEAAAPAAPPVLASTRLSNGDVAADEAA